MSKKKSYMNKDNILTEAKLADMLKFFTFFKAFKDKKWKKDDRKLLKNRSVLKHLAKFNALYKDASADIERQAKELGIDLYQG